MRNDIQPKLEKIGDYFSRNEFYIPSYQRPYSWKREQCEQLLEDINIHKENFDEETQDNYFFGAILIAQDQNEPHDVILIDGQQRTTTFMLLSKAILLKITEEISKISRESSEDKRLLRRLENLQDDIIAMLFRMDEEERENYITENHTLSSNDIKYKNDSISEIYSKDLINILVSNNIKDIKENVIQKKYKQKENRYTDFYLNFKFFYDKCAELTNTEIRDFAEHFIKHCQVITITSYNTDQAINIFNSLNGTGVPLTPIEVIVSRITSEAGDREYFEKKWREIVTKTEGKLLSLNLLITHYIFVKLSENNGTDRRNPGIKAFFSKNKDLLKNDQKFIEDLNIIIGNYNSFIETPFGKLFNKFNGAFQPFLSSYFYKRDDADFSEYLLKLAALLEITSYSYGHKYFKGFLENINQKFSMNKDYSDKALKSMFQDHINNNFNKEEITSLLNEGGVSSALVFLNEYLYCKENNLEFHLTDNVDIEHVMPASGKNRENIMASVGANSEEEYYEYAEKLGNKIILESSVNRRVSDAWFETKRNYKVSNQEGYIGSKYQIARALIDYPRDKWELEDIDIATQKAAKRITDFIFE